MKKFIKPVLLCAGLAPVLANAQLVDRTKYPDFSSAINPDYSLLEKGAISKSRVALAADADQLPDHVNNAELKFFPPVFNQDGGSCGSASRICYMFTHEINAYRDADAKLLTNRYPSHFVWLLTNGNSGKDEFVQFVGVPNAEVYGGTTYSALFGNQDTSQDHFGWMQGYDKWYSAMWNRMLRPAHFPMNVQTEEGRKLVKQWLYNHNGDTDFHGGGIVGIGVASGGDWQRIPKTPANDEAGVTGKYFVNSWGAQVDHALTIVGYDDRIEFDLDGNGVKGEKNKDEVGAWIVVNSWSDGWCNNGFIYCPYKHATPVGRGEGGYWQPEIYKVRKNYRPLRTIKIKMDYSRRSELYLSAGISSDLKAELPQATLAFDHFKFAGDGANGNTNPAPEIPMLGRWADGKLHDEPMEFGYDLTDLSANFDKNQPLKYFFVIESRPWAEGKGKIYNASIIDYEFDKLGVETPFNLGADGVEVKNQGNKTIISVVVSGESFYAPTNLSLIGKQLTWNAPLNSAHKIKNYKLYGNGYLIAELNPDQLKYELKEEKEDMTYSVTAVYEEGVESSKINVNTPIKKTKANFATYFNHSGFSIPNVFSNKYEECTIEYWLRPSSICDWNQSGGPGWGTFMFHANNNGAYTAGWDTDNRITTNAGKLSNNRWSHIAIVVKKNEMKVYINGAPSGSVRSNNYSGIGGFGNLVFSDAGNRNDTHGRIDEIRIWNYAKGQSEIMRTRNLEFSGNILPAGLLAYFKGDTVNINGKAMLRDCVAGNHAEILNDNFNQMVETGLKMNSPKGDMSLEIIKPEESIHAGVPVEFAAKYSNVVNNLVWTAEGAGVKDLQIAKPTLTFKETGEQTISVIGTNAEGEDTTAVCTINVEAAPAPDATFEMTQNRISAGERVSFIVKNPAMGYKYEWSMPGADVESSTRTNCATSYPAMGEYTVTLKVTAPDGTTDTSSQNISVVEVAPVANFDVAPAVVLKGETTFLKDMSKFTPNQWQWLIHGGGKNLIINGQNSSLTLNIPGVYDVTLTAKNGTGSNSFTRQRALTVCNADSKNGLNFSKNDAVVKLTKVPFEPSAKVATIDWWMKPATLSSICCGLGEESSIMMRATADGSATIFLNDNKCGTPSGFITAGEWHHYAIVFQNRTFYFYRDGNLFCKDNAGTGTLPTMNEFLISSPMAPINGQIDEFRIWNKALRSTEIKEVANQPLEDIQTAVTKQNLAVYYSFNQSGGNVKDLTGNGNEGIRSNFGPDGDAWGLSKGVFSLNFDETAKSHNVTDTYLKNYKKAFKNSGESINAGNKRFMGIADWTLENATVEGDVTTGVHVDNQKESCFTFTSGWDDFGTLQNHKAYQTMTLPAGSYTFVANYGNYEGACGDSYITVSKGKGLPDSFDIGQALSYTKMEAKSNTHMSNSVSFVLPEETEVSLGLVINLGGRSCCTISDFRLERSDIEIIDANDAQGYDLTVDGSGQTTLCLPYPTVLPENVTAYVATQVDGTNVILEAIEGNVVPANTGVIIKAAAGKYHFEPSTTGIVKESVLLGVNSETKADSNKRYYAFDAQDKPGFYLINSETLEANHAYLVRDLNDTNDFYAVEFVTTGIEGVETDTDAKELYDLSGRRVNNAVKGVYISNGNKVLVK